MNSLSMDGGIFQRKSRAKQRGFIQKMHQILDRLIILISFSLLSKRFYNTMIRIDFQMFFSSHVTHGRAISQGLGLHDSLHVGSPTWNLKKNPHDMTLKYRHIWKLSKNCMKKNLPYWEVTIQHGELTRRLDTTTFSTFLSRMSFMTLHKLSYLALSSSRFFFSSSSSGVEKKFVKLMIYAHLENKLTNNLICTINIELLSYLEVQGLPWWLKPDFCHHTPLVVEQHTHRLVQSCKWPQILFSSNVQQRPKLQPLHDSHLKLWNFYLNSN